MIGEQQAAGAAGVHTPRYHLLERLGQGSMGVVYRAADRLTGGRVALKLVRVGAGAVDSGDFRLALTEEFRTLASLRHPNIISVLDYGFDAAGQPFFTMDELPNARTIVAAAAGQPLPIVIDLIDQVLEALTYLHRRGVVHCDLKPDNVLVTEAGQVKLLDFGLALTRERLRDEADGDSISGTLEYIAPEVLQGDPPATAADLYAVGVMLYELLTGRHPFNRASISQLITETLTKLPDLAPIASHPAGVALAPILARLLSKQPDDRYTSAHDVQVALAFALGRPTAAQSAAIRDSFLQAADFIGREKELAALLDALNTALSGVGSAWLIGGESGVGKTRLLEELRTRALVAGALVLRGQAVSGGALPLHIWRDPVRRLVLSVPVTPLEAGVLKDLIPDIDLLLDQPVEAAPPLDGRAHQQRLNQTIAALFRRSAHVTVLMLEDLHWVADLETLRLVVAAIDDVPLLIAATYRDDERGDLPVLLPMMQVLELKRLTPLETALLSASILGDSVVDTPLLDFLQRETEGNIYFLIEVVRALAEELGGLHAVRTRTLPKQIVAGGMLTVIRRRLDRVHPEAREALRLAAVIGRVIPLDVIRSAFPDLLVDRWLTQCAEAAIFDVDAADWRFAHDKLRETLLADLDADTAQHLHGLAAAALEAVYGAAADPFALADHWDRAGNVAKTIAYARQAGENALAVSAYPLAERLLKRALALMPSVGGDPVQQAERAALLRLLGDLYSRLSDFAASRQHYEDSAALARQLGHPVRLAQALNGLAFVHAVEDNFDPAEQLAQQARRLGEAADHYQSIAHALNNLGMVAEGRRDYAAARSYYQEALVINTAEGEKRAMAAVLNNLGSIADTQGSYSAARELYTRSLMLCEEIGYLYGVSVILNNLGIVAERLLDDVSALDYYERSARLAHEIGNRRGLVTALLNGIFMQIGLNQPKAAVLALRRAVPIARQLDSTHTWAQLAIAEGRLSFTLGNVRKAAEALAAATQQIDFDVDFYALRVRPLLDDVTDVLTPDEWTAVQSRAADLPLPQLFTYIREDGG